MPSHKVFCTFDLHTRTPFVFWRFWRKPTMNPDLEVFHIESTVAYIASSLSILCSHVVQAYIYIHTCIHTYISVVVLRHVSRSLFLSTCHSKRTKDLQNSRNSNRDGWPCVISTAKLKLNYWHANFLEYIITTLYTLHLYNTHPYLAVLINVVQHFSCVVLQRFPPFQESGVYTYIYPSQLCFRWPKWSLLIMRRLL